MEIASILLGLMETLALEMPFAFFIRKRRNAAIIFLLLLEISSNLAFNVLYVFIYDYSESFLVLGELAVFLI
ncbi:MAG TPA: hypothetical protein DEA32_02290, partial [Firmicutes bacterium]|nr:hypothetical protein [Bacillota bacterium]